MPSLKNNIFIRMVFNSMVFAFLGLGFIACDSNRYFEMNEAIEDNIWYYRTAKAFEVEITDSLSAFNFFINVRNTVDYEYANIYLFIQSEMPDGMLALDTVECQLADYQGKWLGNGRGEFRDNRFIIRKNMRFKNAGTYRFKLKHGMRSDSLIGIADVGIRIETVKL